MTALDFSDELLQLSRDVFDKNTKHRVVVTTTANKDQEKEFTDVKESAFSNKKPVIIQLTQDKSIGKQTDFEKSEHFYALCQGSIDKFILLFTFVKLAICEGKTLIFAKDVMTAYRIKLFLNRFHLKAFVLGPDMPKNQVKSIVNFFHMGQYDILIMLHTGYSQRPPALKEVQTVINFDIPQSYSSYKESGGMVQSSNGSVLTLVEPDLNITQKQLQNQTQDLETLAKIIHKMDKNLGRPDMMKCIPVMWNMICKFKSRVESVFLSLSNKQVAREKMLEFKK